MKVFISQPMNGKTDEEILKERNQAIEKVKKQYEDVEIIESYFDDYNPEAGCIPLKYLAKSIELLADADLAVFLKDWGTARGCNIEHLCAVNYGINRIYL